MVEGMDWSKAKNILIVAFIITNIFLIYHIEKDMFNREALEARSEGKIKEVVHILKERNIGVDTDVPMEVMTLPVLEVEYKTYDLSEIQNLFDPEAEVTLLNNNKVIHYEKAYTPVGMEPVSEKKARQVAEKFIANHGFNDGSFVYWKGTSADNGYELLFKQKYKGRILENGHMTITVVNNEVVKFDRIWLNPLKLSMNKVDVIPAPKALLKLMEREEYLETEINITNIDLVYWVDLSQNSFTSWEDVESATAIPAWRIEIDNGEVTLIPAFDDY